MKGGFDVSPVHDRYAFALVCQVERIQAEHFTGGVHTGMNGQVLFVDFDLYSRFNGNL